MNMRNFNNQPNTNKNYESRGNKTMSYPRKNSNQSEVSNYTNVLNIFKVISCEKTDNGIKIFASTSQLETKLNEYGNKFYIYSSEVDPVNKDDIILIDGYIKDENKYITAKNIIRF